MSTPAKQQTSLDSIRHSFAHLLAAAVKQLWPGTHNAIGPSIENGFYQDFDFGARKISEADLPKIEKKMREVLKTWHAFKHWEVNAQEAKKIFKDNPYKLELIEDLAKEGKKITVNDPGNFIDLCKGGHSNNPQKEMQFFKLMSVAGAYWRGDEKRPMLTRIYGVAFASQKELDDYLAMLEEAKKRDHRVLGQQLKLFTFAEEVGPGLPLWLPKGTVVRDEIEKYAKKIEKQWGYQRVTTPHIAKEDLYRMSGHIPYYADSMFPPMKLDDGNYYLKAMNCPHTHMIYRSQPHSYKDLPVRFAEYGTVYRYELSGTLAGLLRVRGFTQNDAHIYCREDQVEEEFLKVMRLHEFWYRKVFGIKDFYMRLSLPAKDKMKYAGVPAGWKKAVDLLRSTMKKSGLPYVEAEGEAAFYGPKVDFQIKSVIGREETASTNQLDFLATERFNLTYTDSDGKEKPLYVIHRAPLGSHERFVAFLIEHYAGAFPLWLAPEQVWIVPISEKFNAYAAKIAAALRKEFPDPPIGRAGIRLVVRDENDTLGKKIRAGQTQKIPYLLIVGEKEKKAKTVSVRSYAKGDVGAWSMTKLITQLKKELKLPAL